MYMCTQGSQTGMERCIEAGPTRPMVGKEDWDGQLVLLLITLTTYRVRTKT